MALKDIVEDQQAKASSAQAVGTAEAPPDADRLLMGGAPSLSFGKIGDRSLFGVEMGGLITDDPSTTQSRDYRTGSPQYWDALAGESTTSTHNAQGQANRPMYDIVVTLATDLRDDEDDDGERRLFLNGDKRRAVKAAVKEAGARGLRKGGKLFIAWTGDAPSKVRGFQDKKLYTARYVPPPPVEVEIGDEEDEAAA